MLRWHIIRAKFAIPLLLLLGAHALADDSVFYIGTMTGGHNASQGIYRGSIDTATGKLGPIALAVEAQNPNFLALSPDHHFLVAALQDAVGSFKIKPDGNLDPINQQPSGGLGPCHVSLDQTGRNLFVANYGSGNIACFPVAPDGSIAAHTALIQFTGSGPNPGRQKQSFAHSVYTDPENKYAYACDLGSDSIWIFQFDAATGTLLPANPPSAKVPPGSGPRHLAFSSDDKFVYVVDEMGVSTTTFMRDAASGALTGIETNSNLLSQTSTHGVTSAEIFVHPLGKWLYVSNRGCDTISVFAIAPDGRLSLQQSAPSGAKSPRSFAIDPTGRWLITAGQNDNRIAVLKIDPATGHITPTDQSADVGAPVCLVFVPPK